MRFSTNPEDQKPSLNRKMNQRLSSPPNTNTKAQVTTQAYFGATYYVELGSTSRARVSYRILARVGDKTHVQ